MNSDNEKPTQPRKGFWERYEEEQGKLAEEYQEAEEREKATDPVAFAKRKEDEQVEQEQELAEYKGRQERGEKVV